MQSAGPLRASGLARRGDVDGDERDRQPHRADLRAGEAQGARQRRRRLRARRARRSTISTSTALVILALHLPVARHHQPVPVPAARRRAHLLGAGREGPRPGDPVQRDGAGRVHRLRARDRAVPRRPDERHRPNRQRRLQTPIASAHGGRDAPIGAATLAEAFRLTVEDNPDRIAVRTLDDEVALHLGAAARPRRRARRRAAPARRQARRHRRADDLQPARSS